MSLQYVGLKIFNYGIFIVFIEVVVLIIYWLLSFSPVIQLILQCGK